MTKKADVEQTAIGPWLFVSVLIISSLGYGLQNIPFYTVKILGQCAYWGILIAAIIAALGLGVIYLLARRFPGQSLIEQGKSILGNFAGTVTGLAYLAFILLMLAMLNREISNQISLYFLNRTPISVTVLIYLLTGVFIASRGIETITRAASFVMIMTMSLLLILLVIGFHNVTWSNLLPLFNPDPLKYLQAGKAALQNFLILGLVALVLPYLKPLDSFPRFAGGSVLVLLLFYLLFTIGTIGVYGSEFSLRFAYPTVEFLHVIDLRQVLLEQAGMVASITWLTMILMGTAFIHYSVALGLSKLIPIFTYKQFVWFIAPIEFLVVIWPTGTIQTKTISAFVNSYGWISLFIYPLVLWLIALVLKKKGAVNS